MKASVVIPTKNGGSLFADVLESVLSQETAWPYEVLVVDSGSTDATLSICDRARGVKVHCIPSSEFGHGRTRNLAVSLTSGAFIAMLTQDAKPSNAQWLRELVEAVEQSPDIAGAFGRHLPYPGRNPFVARDLRLHFDNFANGPSVVRLQDQSRYANDPSYRQFLHFFSDNNACLRRSVWERIPYPDVEFAEDQLWAKAVIEAGYAKAYADRAQVFHSHEFGFFETLRRAYDESTAFRQSFGYKLCPTVFHAVAQTVRCSARDYQHFIKKRLVSQYPEWVVKIPIWQAAREVGHLLGGKSAVGESVLHAILSLDLAKRRR